MHIHTLYQFIFITNLISNTHDNYKTKLRFDIVGPLR